MRDVSPHMLAVEERGSRDLDLLKADLEEYGFVVIEDLLPRDKAEHLAQRLTELEIPKGSYAIFNHLAPDDYELFLPLITNPVLLALAQHMLGPDFKLCGDIGRVWGKPGDRAQALHADVPTGAWYAHNNRPFPETCPVLNCIWALMDFSKDNGATEILPFSHFSRRVPRQDVEYRHLVSAEAPAGSAIAFHGSIWHRRGANNTASQHRMGVSVPYIGQWLDPVTSGWIQIKRSVCVQLPAQVQRLFPHVAEG